MTVIFNTARSALTAQSKALEVSAANVANVRSRGVRPGATQQAGEFAPSQVAFTSRAGGGVEAKAVPVQPASVLLFDPDAPDADAEGIVARPNVSLEREVVNQIQALRGFQANLKVIDAENQKLGALLDLIS